MAAGPDRPLPGSVGRKCRQFPETGGFLYPGLVCLALRIPTSCKRSWQRLPSTEPGNPRAEHGDFLVLVQAATGTPGKPF